MNIPCCELSPFIMGLQYQLLDKIENTNKITNGKELCRLKYICCAPADCIAISIPLCVYRYAQAGVTMHMSRNNPMMSIQSNWHMQGIGIWVNYLSSEILNKWS